LLGAGAAPQAGPARRAPGLGIRRCRLSGHA
jgi:hypothetical protein